MTKAIMPPPPPAPAALPPPQQQEQVIKISDIKIGNRLRKKLGDISSLAASIANIGLLHPPVLDEDNNLIAGFRRIKAYEYLGRTEIPYRRVDIKNAIQGEYDENVERADFALEDIAAIYEEVQKSRVSHRPAAASAGDNNDNDKVGNLPTFPKGPSDVVTGKISGHSEQTVNKIIKIVTAAKNNPEFQKIVDQVDNRKTSINHAYSQVMRAEDRDKPKPAPPEGQYDVLYVDPPWNYEIPGRGTPENHYSVMTDDEIMALHIPAAEKGSVLFLWATYPKLDVAIDVMRAWGFTYKSNLVWVKDKFGTGFYFRGQHELLLLGIKGEGLGVPAEADRHSSVLSAPRTEHSKKPTEVYEIIEKMYPGRSYIELFARGEARKGWTVWGLEATTAEETEETEVEEDRGEEWR